MKKFVTVLLSAMAMLLLAAVPAWALDPVAAHSYYADNNDPTLALYAAPGYLNDTLTLAGSGMSQQKAYTVAELEQLAYSTELGYEHTYSLLTRGEIFTRPFLTGLDALKLLAYAGMKQNLPDETPVKFIAKDGYAITLSLKQLRAGFSCYAAANALRAEATGLPALLCFGSNSLPLVGPTGVEPVYREFAVADGYNEAADNVGGPIRLVVGQSGTGDYNAPNCIKWLAAIVVGDAGSYRYTRVTDNSALDDPVPTGGDWTHHQAGYEAYLSRTLTISGSEADKTVLTLADLEALSKGRVRDYFAASGGRNVYEGVSLKQLLSAYLADGVEKPSAITVIAADGYAVHLDVEQVWSGIDSFYQPGERREIMLAYAVDGAPLVDNAAAVGYNGANAYGPLRLVVENTVSQWVKNVDCIVIGQEEAPAAPSSLSRMVPLSLLGLFNPWLMDYLLSQQ